MYLHFISFLHTHMAQVVETFPHCDARSQDNYDIAYVEPE